MATNLRLSERTAAALREEAARRGTSQAEVIREAVDRYLGIDPEMTDRERAIASGLVREGTPYRDVEPWIVLPDGMTSLDVLDRDER